MIFAPATPQVVFIAMPWASFSQPSLQLGLLSSYLNTSDIASRTLYANLRFADQIGPIRYEQYSSFHNISADWTFSTALFPERSNDEWISSFLRYAASQGCGSNQLAELNLIRNSVPSLLRWVLDAVDWGNVHIAGFTTTMLQPVASLAMAQTLKHCHPHLKILFGGAGCSGSMGEALYKHFTFIDGVVTGEADEIIVPLTRAILEGSDPPNFADLLWRRVCLKTEHNIERRPWSVHKYPVPVYDDYFSQLATYDSLKHVRTSIPFEASRGCWWAVQNHCLFCGLNGDTVEQRIRPISAVIEELSTQSARYNASRFVATDNIIAPQHLLRLPEALSKAIPSAEIFFEVRAVMTRRQMIGLRDGGVIHLQCGIESLVPEILLMTKKGTSPSQNICFLRRAKEVGVAAYWNFICGFPREEHDWYQKCISKLASCFHLSCPDIVTFSLERFSPYFRDHDKYGIQIKGPLPGTRYVWNLPDKQIEDLSFSLDFDAPGLTHREVIHGKLREVARIWKDSQSKLSATLLKNGESLIVDTRPVPNPSPPKLNAAQSLVLRAAERPSSVTAITNLILKRQPASYLAIGGSLGVKQHILELVSHDLLYKDGNAYVALTIPTDSMFWLESDSPGEDSAAVAVSQPLGPQQLRVIRQSS